MISLKSKISRKMDNTNLIWFRGTNQNFWKNVNLNSWMNMSLCGQGLEIICCHTAKRAGVDPQITYIQSQYENYQKEITTHYRF